MREIEFRAKTIDTDEWVYGHYYTQSNGVAIHHYIVGLVTKFEIDPETVGQYISLHDKNGTKIFEGDIVDAPYIVREMLKRKNVKVIWYNAGFYLDMGGLVSLSEIGPKNDLQVIGNIHEPQIKRGTA